MKWRTATWAVLFVAVFGFSAPSLASDERDTAALASFARGSLDINDLYIFRSPSNANNTVLIMTLGSFAGSKFRPVFRPGVNYEFRIDTNLDYSTDLIFTARFKSPKANGKQQLILSVSRGFDTSSKLADGLTNTNLPVAGGGMFRAGVFDDPFFFDQVGFDTKFIVGQTGFPRPIGTAANYYGPTANVLGIVMEIPSVSIAPNGTTIGVWTRTAQRGLQIDRCGKPFTNLMLIPPVPRTDLSRGDRRKAFNRGLPVDDGVDFGDDVKAVFTGLRYQRSAGDADVLTNLILPDLLFFQVGNPNGFGTFIGGFLGNGRRLSDDVTDTLLNVFTNGFISTDNVRDDNGLKVTDGSVDPVSGMTRAIAFPYIGLANIPPGSPSQ